MGAAIEVVNLVKKYGNHTVIHGLSFTAMQGEIFALLGANGAGKTTTLECIEGIRRYHEGTIRVHGRIGVQLQSSSLMENITALEAYKLFSKWNNAKVDQTVLQNFGIMEFRNKQYGTLSTGQKRKLHLVIALINDPDIIILDEPTAGLDPQARAAVWKYIRRVQKERGTTVFLTTHYMDEAETCDEICIMDKGKIAASGTPAELKEEFSRPVLKLQTWDPVELTAFLESRRVQFSRAAESFHIQPENVDMELEILSRFKEDIVSFTADNGSLDDVFLTICGTGTPSYAAAVLKEE